MAELPDDRAPATSGVCSRTTGLRGHCRRAQATLSDVQPCPAPQSLKPRLAGPAGGRLKPLRRAATRLERHLNRGRSVRLDTSVCVTAKGSRAAG